LLLAVLLIAVVLWCCDACHGPSGCPLSLFVPFPHLHRFFFGLILLANQKNFRAKNAWLHLNIGRVHHSPLSLRFTKDISYILHITYM
jgi:hypothetical protein